MMLVEFASEIFEKFLKEFERLQVSSLIKKTIQLLQTLPQINSQNQINSVIQLKNEIDKVVSSLDPMLQSDAISSLFEPTFYAERLPRGVLTKLRGMFTEDGRLIGTPAALDDLASKNAQTIEILKMFVGSSSVLNIDKLSINRDDGIVIAVYSIPGSVIAEDLDVIEKVTAEFQEFNAIISEYYLGEQIIPKTPHLSMSVFSLFLEYSAEIIVFLKVWRHLMRAATATIEASNAAKVFFQADKTMAEALLEAKNKEIFAKLETALQKIDAIEKDSVRRQELRPRVLVVSEAMIGRIIQGARFEVLGGNALAAIEVVPDSGEQSPRSAAQLLEEHRTIQMSIPAITEPQALLSFDAKEDQASAATR